MMYIAFAIFTAVLISSDKDYEDTWKEVLAVVVLAFIWPVSLAILIRDLINKKTEGER